MPKVIREYTFDEYDKVIERLKSVPFRCGLFWPKKEDIQIILKEEPTKAIDFLLWVAETAEDPETEEDKEAKKYVMSLLYKYIRIVD